MEQGTASLPELSRRRTVLWRASTPPSFANFIGRKLLRFLFTIQGLGAFALITLGVMVSKFGAAPRVIHPLIRAHLARSGVRLLPMVMFIATTIASWRE